MTDPPMLTYREAAARVHRTKRCIEYWRARGMHMSWDIRDGQRVRVVDETTLLTWWRDRLRNDPAQRYRLRRIQQEQGLAMNPQTSDPSTKENDHG